MMPAGTAMPSHERELAALQEQQAKQLESLLAGQDAQMIALRRQFEQQEAALRQSQAAQLESVRARHAARLAAQAGALQAASAVRH